MATKYTLWELDSNVLFFQKNRVVVISSWFIERKKKMYVYRKFSREFFFHELSLALGAHDHYW